MLLDKIDTLEKNIKELLDAYMEKMDERCENCRMLSWERHKENSVAIKKAHERLDRHAISIKCLKAYKNRIVGAVGVIAFMLTVLGAYIVYFK